MRNKSNNVYQNAAHLFASVFKYREIFYMPEKYVYTNYRYVVCGNLISTFAQIDNNIDTNLATNCKYSL